MKRQHKLTDAQLVELYEAARPVRYMVAGGQEPISPRERVDNWWARLGEALHFDPATVAPIPGLDDRYFTADDIAHRHLCRHCSAVLPCVQIGDKPCALGPRTDGICPNCGDSGAGLGI